MTSARRALHERLQPLEYGNYYGQLVFAKGDGRVGGFQCDSRYCVASGCNYVLISAVGPIASGAACPSH